MQKWLWLWMAEGDYWVRRFTLYQGRCSRSFGGFGDLGGLPLP
jgi:hypothetical protein